MKKLVCTLAAVLAALPLFGQGTLLVDQQSFDLATGINSTSIIGVGQSFTPGLSAINYVQFGLADSPGSSLFVNLRQNSMTGPIIGTTDTQSITTLDPHVPTTFLFSTAVALTPGTQYFFEPVIVVNANQISIELSNPANPNPYPGGTAFHAGFSSGFDVWFAEGVVVPEPSTWAVFGLGGVVVFAVKVRRRAA